MKVQQMVALGGLSLLWLTGGRRAGVRDLLPPDASPHVRAPQPAPPPPVTLEKGVRPPNEVGVIPILEYHDISHATEKYMFRSVTHFRRDLERLYAEGYRPVSVKEYLDNRIDLPAGKSPVILTFDDARGSQFRYQANGKLDPECAVAILQQFHAHHPDFALKAMFFVLPDAAFDQTQTVAQKLQALVEMGFEIGNHTVTHRNLTRLSDAEVQKEIALCKEKILHRAPLALVDTLAFPGGHAPRNLSLVLKGKYEGEAYANRAGFLAFGAPSPAPAFIHQDRRQILRIVATEDPGGSTDWLNHLKAHPELRYISDGDPKLTTVPKAKAKLVDRKRLNGATLRTY